MSFICRVALILIAILFLREVLVKSWKDKIQTEDSIFWILTSLVALILGIFPQIIVWMSAWMGVDAFALLLGLALLAVAVRCYMLSVKLSQVQRKLYVLLQNINVQRALDEGTRVSGTKDDVA